MAVEIGIGIYEDDRTEWGCETTTEADERTIKHREITQQENDKKTTSDTKTNREEACAFQIRGEHPIRSGTSTCAHGVSMEQIGLTDYAFLFFFSRAEVFWR